MIDENGNRIDLNDLGRTTPMITPSTPTRRNNSEDENLLLSAQEQQIPERYPERGRYMSSSLFLFDSK